jgi:hypothetical protein
MRANGNEKYRIFIKASLAKLYLYTWFKQVAQVLLGEKEGVEFDPFGMAQVVIFFSPILWDSPFWHKHLRVVFH